MQHDETERRGHGLFLSLSLVSHPVVGASADVGVGMKNWRTFRLVVRSGNSMFAKKVVCPAHPPGCGDAQITG